MDYEKENFRRMIKLISLPEDVYNYWNYTYSVLKENCRKWHIPFTEKFYLLDQLNELIQEVRNLEEILENTMSDRYTQILNLLGRNITVIHLDKIYEGILKFYFDGFQVGDKKFNLEDVESIQDSNIVLYKEIIE